MKLTLTCLASLLLVFSLSAQITVRGIVTDQNNQGIAGATIKVDGAVTTVYTNENGEFTIDLDYQFETLIISAEGYQVQSVYVNGRTNIDVKMKSLGINTINMGIGSQSRDELTSSVSSINTADVSPAPLINLEQANQGVTAGLFVQNSSGKLGQGTTVRIRGGSSLTASNQPLYVVDGVPLVSGNQSNINPSNIESIEILKDAAATAIYGTRAANGVIIITTKSGNTGGLKVNVDYQFGLSQTPKTLDLMSPSQFNQMFIESTLRNPILGLSQFITKENLEMWEESFQGVTDPSELVINFPNNSSITLPAAYLGLNGGQNTDWQDEVFRSAPSHRANVDFQGGTEALGYFASLGFTTQEGILVGNKFDRLNGTLTLNSKISSKLSANMNLNYIYTDDDRLNEDQDLGNPMQAIALPPSDTYDPSNNYRLNTFSLLYNPLTEINFADYDATNNSIIGSLGLKYQLTSNLSFDVNGGIDYSDVRVERRQGPQTLDGEGTGLSQLETSDIKNHVFNGWFTYDKDDLSVVLGGSYQDSKADFRYIRGLVNSVSTLESQAGTTIPENPIPGAANSFLSAYTRVGYSIDNKYSFEVSGRVDGSSKFSEENRFGYFPAVSAGWNIHNEDFFNSNSFSSLKLRTSYGLVGNTPTDDFLYRLNYIISQYDDEDGIEIINLENPGLKWETTSQFNVGLDFAFANNRISGSVDYYIKKTEDLLFPVPVSQTSGQSSIIDNVGSMENKGFEFLISSTNIDQDGLVWTTDFNISTNTNTITDLAGEQAIVGTNAFLKGHSAGVFYLVEYLGVDPSTGRALYDDGTTEGTTEWSLDLRKPVGDPNPQLFGGITNSLTYKNWEASALFQFVSGVDIYNATGEFLSNSGILLINQTEDQVDRWYQPGDEVSNPVLNPDQIDPNPSTRWLQDGSYIRLKNITITYNFDQTVLSNMGLDNLSIYVGATNLFTITGYTGYDPDVSYFDPLDGIIGQNISRGIDNFTAPQPRIFLTGIKIGF
ncbi:SusC/RagA family TonB-linked outer membrane protein [Ekhidna sp.]|uniref:SusC/RagA family TonB-linked outer membrane protein n=1 Tax=Ekhidna sp. TaxID=2608089 RepID=UPI003BAD572C